MRFLTVCTAVVGAVGLCVAGCSDDDSGGPTLPRLELSTTAAADSAAASTADETTAPQPATTATTGLEPSSTTPTTDTTPPGSDPIDITPPERDAIVASWEEFAATRTACFRAPAACDRAAIDRLSVDPLRAADLSVVDDRLAAGEVDVPGTTPTYQALLDVVVNDDRLSGSLTACSVNGDITVKPNDPADPADDVVVDDRVISRTWTYTYQLLDGAWKATEVEDQERWEGENRCPPPAG